MEADVTPDEVSENVWPVSIILYYVYVFRSINSTWAICEGGIYLYNTVERPLINTFQSVGLRQSISKLSRQCNL